MIIVSELKSVTGLAGTTAVIAYSLMGTKFTNYGEKPFTLAQGVLTDTAAELYAPETTETAKISTIILTNTSAVAVTGVKLLVDGTQISPALVIPANGCAVFDGAGWKVYNTSGEVTSIAGSALIGNSGAAASTADGGTIAHGFASAPTTVLVSGSVEAEIVTVTSIDATTFTVAIKTALLAPGTTQTVYWMAIP